MAQSAAGFNDQAIRGFVEGLAQQMALIEPTLLQRVLAPRAGPLSRVKRILTTALANAAALLQKAIDDIAVMSSHTAYRRIAER
jgi:hypothetical protein